MPDLCTNDEAIQDNVKRWQRIRPNSLLGYILYCRKVYTSNSWGGYKFSISKMSQTQDSWDIVENAAYVLGRCISRPSRYHCTQCGKNITATAFQAKVDMIYITTKSVPVESTNSMPVVEKCHSPVQHALIIISKECLKRESEIVLQMAEKSINDSADWDCLTQALLVLDALPRLGLSTAKFTKSTSQRTIAHRAATTSMSKHAANRRVCNAFRARNGPYIRDLYKTKISAPVLVYRLEKDWWEGLYSLLDFNEENAIVRTSKEGQQVWGTTVTPNLTFETENNCVACFVIPLAGANEFQSNVNSTTPWKKSFERSKMFEFNDLLDLGAFTIVSAPEAKKSWIFEARFVDSVRQKW